MKLVVNRCYGGFGIPDDVAKELGYEDVYDYDVNWNLRGDLRLIKMIEEDPKRFEDDCTELKVVEIPDNVTDYEIDEYDGVESVTYVVNGKIHHA